ncbi:bile acid/Na+ symporter family transporter [Klebsiella pneumoniae]|uniref:Bile acid/Na+ symporter family transporter n=1 Tax=Klebsiella pneumoniae TaxID=573 RepID=A0A377TZG0_KLEPN|nr:bile acid/Na+ symporter family transporter [Klebsiella pneumoniae]
MKLFRILDPFTATLITVVLLASFFPARGAFVPFFEHLTTARHRAAVLYAWR